MSNEYKEPQPAGPRPAEPAGTSPHAGERIVKPLQHEGVLRAILASIQTVSGDFVGVLEATPHAAIAFDADRRLLHANEPAEALFGFERGGLNGKSTDALIPERLRQPNAPPMAETPDLVLVELPGLMRDGTERPIEWYYGAVRTGGRLVFILTVRDRLELQLAIERLRDSEQRFQLFVNGVLDCAIYMLDAVGLVTSWNAGAARVTGWEATDVVGQSFEVFFTAEDRHSGLPAQLLRDAIAGGSHRTTGWRVRKDGTRYQVDGSLTALCDDDGNVRGFAKITRDLTDRLRAEENERRLAAEQAARRAAQEGERRIRVSEERLARLQRVTAALSEALTLEDVATTVMRECTETLAIAGISVFSLTPSGDTLVLLGQQGHPEDSTRSFRSIPLDVAMPVTDVARQGKAMFFQSFEECAASYPSLRSALGIGGFEATAALPLVARQRLLGVLVVRYREQGRFQAAECSMLRTVGDLCAQALDRARLFAAEREARALAESANRAKDEFLGMLGHELRNPLAPLTTALELLKTNPQGNGQRERAVIERQVTHLHRLVDDLLDVSRVARGLISLSRRPIPVVDVLSNAVEMATPWIEQRKHQLIVSPPPHELFIDADLLRMSQVVSNLLVNAAGYTRPGGHVWLSAERDGGDAVIRVRDDGDGIDAELLPKVFDLFVQGARTFERSKGGLGLGLAIVKSLVNLHGGSVTAASDGKGSEFVVRVPLVGSPGPEASASVVQDRVTPTGAGKRILLVDDNEDARELLGDMLRTLGHDVELAPDGPSALGKLETFAAEVAILDLGLPGIDGFELARRISEMSREARPRLIALTGYSRDVDIAQGRAAGFDAHLVKPVEIPILVAAIDPETAQAS